MLAKIATPARMIDPKLPKILLPDRGIPLNSQPPHGPVWLWNCDDNAYQFEDMSACIQWQGIPNFAGRSSSSQDMGKVILRNQTLTLQTGRVVSRQKSYVPETLVSYSIIHVQALASAPSPNAGAHLEISKLCRPHREVWGPVSRGVQLCDRVVLVRDAVSFPSCRSNCPSSTASFPPKVEAPIEFSLSDGTYASMPYQRSSTLSGAKSASNLDLSA